MNERKEKEELITEMVECMCANQACGKCPVGRKFVEIGDCTRRAIDYLLSKEEPAPAKEPADSTRPKWCNVGQWVRIYGRINRRYLGEITRTHPGLRMVEVTVVEDGKTEVHSCDPTDLRPVRFRPYTFDEALGLLGKTIRYKVGDIIPRASLVTDVAMTDGDVYVILNGTGTPRWQHLHATIDGVPFGVPEIDTDAEKEAAE